MARYGEWLARGRAGRISMAQNWCGIFPDERKDDSGKMVKNYVRWGIPEETFINFITLFDAARGAYQTANNKGTRTSVSIAACDEAFKALVALMRYIKKHWLISPPLTRTEMEELGLRVPDTTHTARPAPETRPETEAQPAGKGTHEVTAINPETQNKSKPETAEGVVFAQKTRAPSDPVSRAEDMPSDYQTGARRVYRYTEADYGKIADYATAYGSANGKRGPWSNVTSLLISG